MVEVTQADRGAAEHWRRNFGRKGTFQDLLKALAAHREAAYEGGLKAGAEAAAATIARLQEALTQHNDRLRSALAVANRDGRDTNWLSFRGQCHWTLAEYHDLVNGCRKAIERGEHLETDDD